jgi:hypothetical protein
MQAQGNLQMQQDLQQKQMQMQMQNSFKNDYYGMLGGLQGILNILYAATGAISYGGMIVRLTVNAVKTLGSWILKAIPTITGYRLLKRIVAFLLKKGRVVASGSLENAWSAQDNLDANALNSSNLVNEAGKRGMGAKILIALRVALLIGDINKFIEFRLI